MVTNNHIKCNRNDASITVLSVIKMNSLYLIASIGLLAVTRGLPMPQAQPRSQSLVPGVFIPADAFKSLQERANANDRNNQQNNNPVYQPNTNNPPITNVPNTQPSYQPVNTNQPQYANAYQPNSQPAQPVMTVQPQTNQPINQAQPMVANRITTTNPNPRTVIMANPSNSQPSSSVIYVPSTPQQTILVPQSSQPISQPSYVIQNGQPANVLIPSNSNGISGPNSNIVYTLIPLNNQNSNSGSYLIPIQTGNSNPIVVRASN